jgi:hypothetical protein
MATAAPGATFQPAIGLDGVLLRRDQHATITQPFDYAPRRWFSQGRSAAGIRLLDTVAR